jgi:uncharacterized protein (TIGR02145 family)
MKKNYSLSLVSAIVMLLLGTFQSFAANFTISFTGSGKSTTVGSVVVQNLTKGTTETVAGGSSLTLSVVTAVDQVSVDEGGLSVINKGEGRSTLSFLAKQAGSTQITAFGIDGRKIVGITENLQEGVNSFQLDLQKGAYLIKVQGNAFSYTAKMINRSSAQSKPQITLSGNSKSVMSGMQKSKGMVATMAYSLGDQLLYKGISGVYATIIPDSPTASKTVDFNFVTCVDADGNNYAVVKIGTQTWMAENLRTTKYRTGSIPNLSVSTDWGNVNLVTGAWVDLDNNVANDTRLGKLYNWFAATDVRNIAPVGWHVPTIDEYTTLATTLGGVDVAGLKLKETGIINWVSDPLGSTNESGFSARAGGKFNSSGVMNDYDYNYLWTKTEFSATNATCAFLAGPNANLTTTYSPGKRNGYSIRCVLD